MNRSTAQKESTPKVSVCIPVYNGAKYIQRAVESALEQDYQDFEIVIVDNCSTDATAVIIENIVKQCDKIRFFRNNRNIGLAGNLNKCVEHACGEYIKFLCVDDLLLPGCLKQMTAVLNNQATVSLVCCGRLTIDDKGMAFGLRHFTKGNKRMGGHNAISRCMFGGNFIGEPTAVMFRKSDLVSSFRDDLPQLMDMELWFRILEQGDLWSIGAPLCSIQSHYAQITHANVQSGKLIIDNIRLFSEFSNKPYLIVSPWRIFCHKFLMTYRTWHSRKYISSNFRKEVLTQYGIRWLFFAMPVFYDSLRVIRKTRSYSMIFMRQFDRLICCR